MSDLAIRVENLSKSYRVGRTRVRHDTLRDLVTDRVRSLGRRADRDRAERVFWALRDVSFDVRQGEVVGLVGRNGAGKSTILKILSRITEPTSGRAEIHGRVGSLLEVGTGFDPELTGRENIYLSGAILGMRKGEIDRKFQEIVEFAEIGRFIDTPVKRYSSGMYVRLAFAVAGHLGPEILLVDEVLAVGDAGFQRKCLGRIGEVSRENRTVVFVSHNMSAVARLCQSAIWIDGGQIQEIGRAADVVMHYLAAGQTDAGEVRFDASSGRPPGSEYISLAAARLRDDSGCVTTTFDTTSGVTLEMEYRILRRASSLRLGFALVAHDGTVILASRDADGGVSDGARGPGTYVTRCTISARFLSPGQYALTLGCDTPRIETHFLLERALVFHVEDVSSADGPTANEASGLVRVSLPWASDRMGH